MEKSINERIFELSDEGVSPGKIAQKLKVKKAIVMDILGEAGKSEGLGSMIEAVTKATGIKAAVEAITDDCGCKARAEKLNKIFPNRKLNDLLNDQYDFLHNFFTPKAPGSVNRKLQVQLVDVYNHVFNSKREVSSCGVCVAGMIKQLKKIYDESSNN